MASPGLPTRTIGNAIPVGQNGAPPPPASSRHHRYTQAHPGAPPSYVNGRYHIAFSPRQITRPPVKDDKGSLNSIIEKFSQAMTNGSESTRSSTLRLLDDAAAARLADICESEVGSDAGLRCGSTASLQTGMLSRSATAASMPLTVRSPRGSRRGPQRQASGPSLKAIAMATVGGTPGSPRNGWPSISRSSSASGLGFGPFDRRGSRSRSLSASDFDASLEASTLSLSSKHAALASPWEQYKNAARRAKLLQHQLALATAEASKAAAVVRMSSCSVLPESVPDSGRSQGASSSAGSVGSRRLLSGRRATTGNSGESAEVALALKEDHMVEQKEELRSRTTHQVARRQSVPPNWTQNEAVSSPPTRFEIACRKDDLGHVWPVKGQDQDFQRPLINTMQSGLRAG